MCKLNTSTSKYSINDKAQCWGQQIWCWSVLFRRKTRSLRWTRLGCRRSGWAASSSLASPRTQSSPALYRSHWNSCKYYCLLRVVCQHEVLFENFKLKYCWTTLTGKMNMKKNDQAKPMHFLSENATWRIGAVSFNCSDECEGQYAILNVANSSGKFENAKFSLSKIYMQRRALEKSYFSILLQIFLH